MPLPGVLCPFKVPQGYTLHIFEKPTPASFCGGTPRPSESAPLPRRIRSARSLEDPRRLGFAVQDLAMQAILNLRVRFRAAPRRRFVQFGAGCAGFVPSFFFFPARSTRPRRNGGSKSSFLLKGTEERSVVLGEGHLQLGYKKWALAGSASGERERGNLLIFSCHQVRVLDICPTCLKPPTPSKLKLGKQKAFRVMGVFGWQSVCF